MKSSKILLIFAILVFASLSICVDIRNMKEHLKEQVEDKGEKMEHMKEDVEDKMHHGGEKMQEMKETMQEKAQEGAEKWQEMKEPLKEKIQEMKEGVKEKLYQGGEKLQQVKEDVKGKVQEQGEKIQQMKEDVKEEVGKLKQFSHRCYYLKDTKLRNYTCEIGLNESVWGKIVTFNASVSVGIDFNQEAGIIELMYNRVVLLHKVVKISDLCL